MYRYAARLIVFHFLSNSIVGGREPIGVDLTCGEFCIVTVKMAERYDLGAIDHVD